MFFKGLHGDFFLNATFWGFLAIPGPCVSGADVLAKRWSKASETAWAPKGEV